MTGGLDPREDFDNPVVMDFDEPEDPKANKPKKPKKKKAEKPKPAAVVALPKYQRPLSPNELRQGVSERNRAATNLKLAGASYLEIAETLEFKTAEDARRAVEATLAATHRPDDYETLRLVEGARAEALFQRSLAMASADYLVTEEGERVPNTEKLAWHRQASADLMNHAIITGAKAATKVEITPDEEKLDAIVNRILEGMGVEEVLDAEVLELEQVPDYPGGD